VTQDKRRNDDEERKEAAKRRALRMSRIAHKILVLSGKGGVGKSTVAVNLAVTLHEAGKRVGLLDIDVHGPSVPKLLGVEGTPIDLGEDGPMIPVDAGGIRVMSVAFLLQGEADPVIWRGPMKHGVIGQFLSDVDWGELDYLIVDAPPGTGDEPLSVCQLVPDADGAIVVTTPQDLSVADVRRSIGFCRQLKMRVLGVIENMSGLVCPKCGERVEVFKAGGGRRLAMEMHVPFLGAVPLDPAVVVASDEGKPFVTALAGSAAAKAFSVVVDSLFDAGGDSGGTFDKLSAAVLSASKGGGRPAAANEASTGKDGHMRFGIPMAQGKLALHFGHCEAFALVDAEDGKIVGREDVPTPDHQPGLLPRWLAEQGANVIIAGGMGQRAVGLFTEQGIEVVVGAPSEEPEELVKAYVAGTLATGENVCDH